MGRSRGGFGTKIHAICDRNGLPLGVVLSNNARHDSVYLKSVLETVRVKQKRGRSRNRPNQVVADKAYSSDEIRTYLRSRGIIVTIPEKSLRKGTKRRKKGPHPKFDEEIYKERNVVERMFGWLKECRRIGTRYEKKAVNFLAMVKLGFIKLYFKKHFTYSGHLVPPFPA